MDEQIPFQSQSFKRGKFKEMVLYFTERAAESGDAGFGMVKLNKLLYRADFEAYRTLGRAITGETYERQKFGPVARDLPIVLDELAASGRLYWQRIPAGPHTRTVPSAQRDRDALADKSAFPSNEMEVMERVFHELAAYGGKAVSEWSHEQSAGWNIAGEDGAVIEYATALISTDPVPKADLDRASRYVRDRGWIKAS
jgi:uncharacterized phage-associated protein